MVVGKDNNSTKMHFADWEKESLTDTLIWREIQKKNVQHKNY